MAIACVNINELTTGSSFIYSHIRARTHRTHTLNRQQLCWQMRAQHLHKYSLVAIITNRWITIDGMMYSLRNIRFIIR